MRNIKLSIRYDGTRYAGWQSQKNGLAIQDVVEDAVRKITGRKSHITGSGRTDAGVHAEAQVANFKTRSKIPLKNLRMALNSALPDDIIVSNIEEEKADFNAQKNAKSKTYRYSVCNSDFMDPFVRKYSAKCFYLLDLDRMRRAAKILTGRHDFSSFQAVDGGRKNAIRTIKYIRIEKTGDMVYIYIEGNGFLYNMVRNIAGTLIETGRGKFSLDQVKKILKKKNRRYAGPTMSAKGLCLVRVKY